MMFASAIAARTEPQLYREVLPQYATTINIAARANQPDGRSAD